MIAVTDKRRPAGVLCELMADRDAPTRPSAHNSAYILVVEDDEPTRDLIATALRGNLLPVEEAADGAEALELLVSARRLPVLVILDLALPRMEGEVFAHELRRLHGTQLPILITSALDGAKAAAAARRVGSASVVPKPFELDDLIQAARAAIQPSSDGRFEARVPHRLRGNTGVRSAGSNG